jgi:hypothetical protein
MSEAPLPRRLQIKPGQRIAILNAPDGYLKALGELPAQVSVSDKLSGEFDLIQAFFSQREQVEKEALPLKKALRPGGILWISYPKLSANAQSDLSRDILWRALAPVGLRPVAQIAVDETWSALRFKLAY